MREKKSEQRGRHDLRIDIEAEGVHFLKGIIYRYYIH